MASRRSAPQSLRRPLGGLSSARFGASSKRRRRAVDNASCGAHFDRAPGLPAEGLPLAGKDEMLAKRLAQRLSRLGLHYSWVVLAATFVLAVQPSAVTLAVSQNTTLTVNMTSNSNFADTVALGCASLPVGVSCHFSSLSAKLSAGGSTSVQLTIDTNNPFTGGASARNEHSRKSVAMLAGLFLPLSLGFGCFFWRLRRQSAIFLAGALLLVLSAVSFLLAGCRGFSVNSVAPGKYVIQVTGTGTNSSVQEYQDISLTITK